MAEGTVFNLLHPRLRRLLRRHGYTRPTRVQARAIPVILQGYNTLVVAPTGSGKTEAALFPIFSRLLESRPSGIRAIYVTPLRSLNRDIFKRMSRIAESVGLRLEVRHGDSSPAEKKRFLSNPPDIMVTTPETLYFLLSVKRFRENITGLKYVVVDEAHELFSSKRGAEFSLALERIDALYSKPRLQIIALSATVKDPYRLGRLVFSWRHFIVVDDGSRRRLEAFVDTVGGKGRALAIAKYVAQTNGPVIVFVNTRDTAEVLGVELKEVIGENDVVVHHGSLSVDVRVEAEERLKKSTARVVVATSSLELGIDVGSISLVVQYMSPRQVVKFLQRAGRAGHREKDTSRAVIVSESNLFDILESAVIAARAVRGNLEDLVVYKCPVDALLHQLVGMAIETGGISLDTVHRIVTRSSYYADCDITGVLAAITSLASATGVLRAEGGRVKPGPRGYRYYFATTMIPDTRHFDVVDIESGKRIGVLDEEFVVTLSRGDVFLLSGHVWEVVDLDDEKSIVRVRRLKTRTLIPPSWEGDLIPVERLVAREVGSIFRRFESIGVEVLSEYPLSPEARGLVEKVLREHQAKGLPLPTDKRVVIEYYGDTFIIYTMLGSRANKALELALAGYIEEAYGVLPRTASTPYIVALKMPRVVEEKLAENSLRMLSLSESEELEELVRRVAKRSRVYQWILLHVAQRAGALPRDKSLSITRAVLRQLSDTVLGEEALRELYTRKLDLPALREFLSSIQAGKVALVTVRPGKLSPLALQAVGEVRFSERVSPEKLPPSILAAVVKRRLESRDVILVCTRCGHVEKKRISLLPEKPLCSSCGSTMIAPFFSEESARKALQVIRLIQGRRPLNKKKRSVAREVFERASLVSDYGRWAIIALASRGVGVHTAKQVLRALKFGEEAFYKAIVEAEARFHVYKHRLAST